MSSPSMDFDDRNDSKVFPKRELAFAIALVLIGFIYSSTFAQCTNVALNKPATGTGPGYNGEAPAYAFDGICTNAWNSGVYAPQSIQVNLQGTYTINNINLVAAMTPGGNCTHYIFTAPAITGPWTPVDTITGSFTNLQHIERCYSGSPLLNVGAVKVETVASPSWVAWGEIGIFAISTDTIGGAASITSSGPLTFCQGDSVKLTAAAGSSYSWSTGATTQSITVHSSNTYGVTIMENSCISGTQTCTICPGEFASVNVIVNPAPLAGLISGPVAVCAGDSVQLSDTGAIGTIQWQSSMDGVSFMNMGGDTLTINNIIDASQTTYYRALADATCGTDSTAPFKLLVNQPPVAIIAATDSVICSGDTSNICAPGGYAIYSWSNNDTGTCISVTVTGNYNVVIKDVNGCSSSSNTIPVTVHTLPQDSISVKGATVFCFGDSSQLCSSQNFSGYQWNTGDTTACIQATQPGGYYLEVTDQNGCTAQSDTIPIAVYPVPVDSIYSNKPIFCSGDSALLCAQTSFFTYQWNVGDTGSCIYGKQAGDYYVTITDANGCTAESNHVLLSVYPVPSVSIIVQGDTLSSYGAVSYQWFFNDTSISGATGSTYVAKKQGSYSLEITDNNGCTATSSPVNITLTGIIDLTEEGVSLYPNPSVGSWQLVVDNSLVGSNLGVYDDNGRIVFQSIIRSPKSEISLDAGKGIYLLRIASARTNITKKLIKL